MEEDKFIFLDEEKNYMLVIWDRKIFEKEYCRLQNKYRENELEWVDFYDELEERLKLKWVKLVADIDILCHNDFCFN